MKIMLLCCQLREGDGGGRWIGKDDGDGDDWSIGTVAALMLAMVMVLEVAYAWDKVMVPVLQI